MTEVLIDNAVKMLVALRAELNDTEYNGHLDEELAEIIHLMRGGTNG